MALGLEALRPRLCADNSVVFEKVLLVLHSCSINQVIDLAVMDDEDVDFVLGKDESMKKLGLKIRDHAVQFKNGWAALSKLEFRRPDPSVLEHLTRHAPAARPSCGGTKSSASALRAATSSFTKRVVLGAAAKRAIATTRPRSLLARRDEEMIKALDKVHSVFAAHAQESPRFVTMLGGPPAMMEMQRQSYRMGSRSAKVVAQRARAAESFFLDIAAFRWPIPAVSPFQVATWVRSRCAGGAKTAAAHAGATLRVVQWATDWHLHLEHPLVQGQIKPPPNASDDVEKPKSAATPPVEMMLGMEGLVKFAATPQLRCLAGFFLCLAYGSSRAGDLQA